LRALGVFAAILTLVLAPTAALAHGGSYQPPGTEGGPGFQVPPDVVARSRGPLTAGGWSRWWASNKERYLNLMGRLQVSAGPVTGGGRTTDEIRVQKLHAWRETLVPLFIEAVADDNPRMRATAAIALGKTQDPRGSEPLRRLVLKDPDDSVRASAVIALGLLGREGDLLFLDGRLCNVHENSRRRAFAAFAIGMIGGDDAAASLVRFVTDRLPLWREGAKSKERLLVSAYFGLGLTGSADAAPLLREVAIDDREELVVRTAAILGLGRLGDRESLVPLGKILGEVSTRAILRAPTATAIASIATLEDHLAIRHLIDASKGERDMATMHRALIGLGPIRAKRVYRHLSTVFRDASNATRPVAALSLGFQRNPQAASLLRKALTEDVNPGRRGSYCLALGLIGDRSAARLLEKELTDSPADGSKRWAALGLGLMQAVGARDTLVDEYRATDRPGLRTNLCVALLLLGDRRGTLLLRDMLADGNVITGQMSAAVTLGAVRAYDAAPKLVDLFRNKKTEESVRIYAVVGLGFLADPEPIPRLARLGADGYRQSGTGLLQEVLSIL